jgi:hypothetical protein
MSEYKYTKDGKKVAVIGKLNNEEWIVQEIFVSNGKEFPAGENFVERTLLDEPAETWEHRQTREAKENLEKYKAQIEALEKEARIKRRKRDAAQLINRATEKYQNIDFEQLNTLFAFMVGEITHLVTKRYSGYEIVSLVDGIEATDNWHGRVSLDGIKLVSLFGCNNEGRRGQDDRTFSLDYRVNNYQDGSGNWGKIYPCSSLEEAKQKVDEFLSDEDACDNSIKLKKKYNLANPTKKKIKEYYARCVKGKKENVKSAKQILKDKEKELREAEKMAL